MVVNESRRPLRASVVSGHDTTECGCSVAPGDSLRLGYYALEPGSGVTVHDTARASGHLAILPDRVDSTTGAVVFRVSDASLVRPPSSVRPGTSRQRPAAPSNPLKTFLPVR